MTDIFNSHFNLDSIVRETGLPNMDSKDVEEIFKDVLTDEVVASVENANLPANPNQATNPVNVFSVNQHQPNMNIIQGPQPIMSPSSNHPGEWIQLNDEGFYAM